ncbi:MAG: 3-dehydroquinate synthase [Candidatus Marinimicrobia bacterium]|nr:3-dehydroquinate synthase [Candidatus Neomarinimicrobiota bacterium]
MKNIILIGFMGSGKDSVGREISRRSSLAFISTDRMIELTENRRINDIFQQNGESNFRHMEMQALRSIRGLQNIVSATGGGMVIDEKNRKQLSNLGIVVHLYVDAKTVRQRVQNDQTRPLLKERNAVERLLSERKELYNFADIVIDTRSKTPGQIAGDILLKLKLKESKKISSEPESTNIKTASSTYNVIISENGDTKLIDFLRVRPKRCAVISNPLVAALYLDPVANQLDKAGIEVVPVIVPDGERYKSLKTVSRIYDKLFEYNLDRSDIVLGLGGGVITDIAGFVAATLKRGCRLVNVPTTLLAQVDASVGGKTGVNHPLGKNLIGSFYQPDLVLADMKFLKTLSGREFRNGLAEVIKIAVIGDETLFNLLVNRRSEILTRESKLLREIVTRCVCFKRDIVQEDEKELTGRRSLLNFGHTIGHIIETGSKYRRIKHGEAVAMGMVMEAKIALQIDDLTKYDVQRITDLIASYNLPISSPHKFSNDDLQRYILQDKKIHNGKLNLPVLRAIGESHIKELEWNRFVSFMDQI